LGEDREFLDKLHLTEKEREYYDGLSNRLFSTLYWYWTLPITLILNDDDGMLDDMATVSGQIDASALFEFLQKVQE